MSVKLIFRRVVLCFLLGLIAHVVWAGEEFTVGDFKYKMNDDGKGVTVLEEHVHSDTVVIPRDVSYDGYNYPVTAIGDECFYNHTIKSVTIPATVTSLGNGCFAFCRWLASIEIPSSVVSLGDDCFLGCGIYCIKIPSSVTSIGKYCFRSSSLRSVEVPASVISLGEGCFSSCGLRTIDLYANIEKLPREMFKGCSNLVRVKLPETLISVDSTSFSDCESLSWLIIPSHQVVDGLSPSVDLFVSKDLVDSYKIKYIGNNIIPFEGDAQAFEKEGEFAAGCIWYKVNSDGKSVTAIRYIGEAKEFDGSVTIPSEVKCGEKSYIVTSLEQGCVPSFNVKSVEIPSSVTSLGDNCFSECRSLRTIEIPQSVTHIGEECFFMCEDLTTVDLLGPITSLEAGTFAGCTSLTAIYIPPTVCTLGKGCFSNCRSLYSLILPVSVVSVGVNCFWNCNRFRYGSINVYSPVVLENLPENCTLYVYGPLVSDYRRAYPNNSVYTAFMHLPGECESPIVSYSNGHLFFNNRNANFHYNITSEDWKEWTLSSESIVDLSGKCNVMVYASALDCLSSDTVTATITWVNGRIDETEYASTSSLHRQSSALIQSLDENRASAMREVDKGICQSPTVSYSNGKLRFACDTPGASYYYSVRPVDVCGERYSEDGDVSLTGKYEISVYATADGYEPSEIVNVTLSWSDAMVDGAETGVDGPSARSVHASVCDGMFSVLDLSDGDVVSFYTLDGKLVGRQRAEDGKVSLPVLPLSADVIIARIGNQSIKVMLR